MGDWPKETLVQFISENIHLKRSLITDNDKYFINFQTRQNVNNDMGMIEFDERDPNKVVNINMRAFLVLYDKENEPYRYKEIDFDNYDYQEFVYDWKIELQTDNTYDSYNKIKILDLYIPGTTDKNYGYFEGSTKARIYLLAKFDKEYGTHDLHSIVPDLTDWTVTNMYEVYEGIHFFTDYSAITNAHIDVFDNNYTIEGVPVLGYHYMYNEDNIFDFITHMNYKKMYIDESLDLLENSFEVDFKLFNTYGPSRLFTIDEEGTQSIGRIDISMKFELSLKSSSDIYTTQSIIEYIKDYIEDLNDLGTLHINNLLSDVREKYKTTINYFDFLGFNDFDGTYLHLYQQNIEDMEDKYIAPEFINVRNNIDVETEIVTPEINIITINTTRF